MGGPKSVEHCADFQAAQWLGAPERIVDRLEVDAYAATICGEDRCGEVWNGACASSGRDEPVFNEV